MSSALQSFTTMPASSAAPVNMLNLIDGKSAIIEGDFEPFIVHYAETFIIPASIKEYTIKPYDCDEVKVLKAYVRN